MNGKNNNKGIQWSEEAEDTFFKLKKILSEQVTYISCRFDDTQIWICLLNVYTWI